MKLKGFGAERLTGTLLDRLTSRSNAEASSATRERGELQAATPRESILRDLEWLFKTAHLEASRDLSLWPRVRASSLNYGIPALTGLTSSGADLPAMESKLAQIVERFEPRLHPESIQVRVLPAVDDQRSLTLEVTGVFNDLDGPSEIRYQTRLDAETGKII